ncbi:MAG TPA: hypothetical protein VEG30_09240 [Terriglobales bacterium]|nr:hypothetical protein [Terriglobales bacterium]
MPAAFVIILIPLRIVIPLLGAVVEIRDSRRTGDENVQKIPGQIRNHALAEYISRGAINLSVIDVGRARIDRKIEVSQCVPGFVAKVEYILARIRGVEVQLGKDVGVKDRVPRELARRAAGVKAWINNRVRKGRWGRNNSKQE